MHRKIIFLFLFIFLLSGCEANYNLTIDDSKYKEETTVLENDVTRFKNDNMSKMTYDNFSKIPLPLMDYIIPPTPTYNEDISEEKEDGIKYYEVNNLTNNNSYGMKYKGSFNTNNFKHSAIVNYASPNFSYKNKNNEIIINNKNLNKMFNQFKTLDKITIKIKINNYKVEENNADEVNNNVYIWNINKQNYNNKSIYIKINTNSNNIIMPKKTLNKIKNIQNKEIIIICTGLLLVVIFIYLYTKKASRKVNKI